jgi:hypothetical protein
MSHTPEYSAWKHMKYRCSNSFNYNYNNYGARGIKVCDRWIDSFSNFYEDMGNRPSNLHSLDRIDNNGNYELTNCRWATKEVQNSNRRLKKRTIRHKGVSYSGDKYLMPFKATITIAGKAYYLGTFETEEEASSVFNNVWQQVYDKI